jgi:hypothetical protein
VLPPRSRPRSTQPEAGVVALPAFQRGGRVERTGIALVHEGEYIVPAPGSEAAIAPNATVPAGESGQVINYHFPVEVVVIGGVGAEQLGELTEHVLGELETALRSRA